MKRSTLPKLAQVWPPPLPLGLCSRQQLSKSWEGTAKQAKEKWSPSGEGNPRCRLWFWHVQTRKKSHDSGECCPGVGCIKVGEFEDDSGHQGGECKENQEVSETFLRHA